MALSDCGHSVATLRVGGSLILNVDPGTSGASRVERISEVHMSNGDIQ